MAKHNSIDLNPGSQDLSSSFYLYHRQYGGTWYIKNSAGQFLDCSDDFLSFCGVEDLLSLRDRFLSGSIPISCFGKRLKRYEDDTRGKFKEFLLFSVMDVNGVAKPFLITLKPFGNYVYVKIDGLFFMGLEKKVIHAVYPISDNYFDSKLNISRFIGVNPFCGLLEHEQIVAWLMSVGASKREMARSLSKSERYIVNTMNSIYTSLVVGGYDNYMALSEHFQWSKYIPNCLLRRGHLIEICLI
ncbi:hypothetical protein [Escherichia coli]|uniref:Uncharacterized protein n=1 Tax=Escherichia coli TA447 TaxID=656447 RepID=A0A1X3IT43_ECOLX|nr:hypothetical protein [Escherichia coli]OSK88031.1 hypothetical protein ECXG_04230 [Escherichia coli TA447]